MTTADQAFIEQIVASVLAQLQPPAAPRSTTPTASAAPPSAPGAGPIELLAAVLTAEQLAERVRPGQAVRIGARTLLTPTARDWLKTHKVSWSRLSPNAVVSGGNWQLLASTVTPAVRTLQDAVRRESPGWKQSLVGSATEAADAAVRAVTTAEVHGVLVITSQPEAVACLANRSPKIRAAVVTSADQLRLLAASLGPNVLAANPAGRSFIDLRNLVRGCAALGRPQAPSGWQ